MTRKPLKKSVRFEVFKRDKFTCQYCGAKAPEAVLHADHIHPVAKGGTDDLINLVTACESCNLGKGARQLSDDAAVARQRTELERLAERREQLEMLMQWHQSEQEHRADFASYIRDHIEESTGYSLSDHGAANIKRWASRYSEKELLAAIDDAFGNHFHPSENEQAEKASWEDAFARIPKYLSINRQAQEKPYIRRLAYIQGIIRRKARRPRYNCIDYLEHIHLCGMSLDELEGRAKSSRNLEDFEGPIDAWLTQIGEPF